MAGRTSPVLGVAIVAAAAAMFGMLGPVTRFSYEMGLTPFAFIAWRSIVATAAAGGFVIWRLTRRPADAAAGGDRTGVRRGARRSRLGGRTVLALMAAATGGFLVNIGMFMAFQRIPVALVLLTFYTYPALVAVVAVALGRERLDRTRAVALGLASLGMVAVVATQAGDTALGFDLLGVGLALLAAAGQTLFVTVSRDGYPTVPTDVAMTFILAFIAVGGAVAAFVVGTGDGLVHPLGNLDLLALLIFAGLFTAAIPSLLFLAGIRLLGGMRAGILMLIEPMVGVLLAALLLAEPLQPIQLLGGLGILAAALILGRAPLEPADGPGRAAGAFEPPSIGVAEPSASVGKLGGG